MSFILKNFISYQTILYNLLYLSKLLEMTLKLKKGIYIMSEVKQNLQEIIESKMIPECKAYLDDLHNIMDNQTATQDDQEAIKEMQDFMQELEQILQALTNDQLTDEDAQIILSKIYDLLESHQNEAH